MAERRLQLTEQQVSSNPGQLARYKEIVATIQEKGKCPIDNSQLEIIKGGTRFTPINPVFNCPTHGGIASGKPIMTQWRGSDTPPLFRYDVDVIWSDKIINYILTGDTSFKPIILPPIQIDVLPKALSRNELKYLEQEKRFDEMTNIVRVQKICPIDKLPLNLESRVFITYYNCSIHGEIAGDAYNNVIITFSNKDIIEYILTGKKLPIVTLPVKTPADKHLELLKEIDKTLTPEVTLPVTVVKKEIVTPKPAPQKTFTITPIMMIGGGLVLLWLLTRK